MILVDWGVWRVATGRPGQVGCRRLRWVGRVAEVNQRYGEAKSSNNKTPEKIKNKTLY